MRKNTAVRIAHQAAVEWQAATLRGLIMLTLLHKTNAGDSFLAMHR